MSAILDLLGDGWRHDARDVVADAQMRDQTADLYRNVDGREVEILAGASGQVERLAVRSPLSVERVAAVVRAAGLTMAGGGTLPDLTGVADAARDRLVRAARRLVEDPDRVSRRVDLAAALDAVDCLESVGSTPVPALDQPVVHELAVSWTDGPGQCGARCACGLIVDGMADLRAASDEIEAHITAVAERARLVDGLRELADWYAAHPDVPAPYHPELSLGVRHAGPGHDDTTGPAEVARIAAMLGVDVTISANGHHAAVGRFGGVDLRVFHVPSASSRRWTAEQTFVKGLTDEQLAAVADPTGLGHSREVDDEVGAVPLPPTVEPDPLHTPDVEHRYQVADLVHVRHWPGHVFRVTAVGATEDGSGLALVDVVATDDPEMTGQVPAALLELATGRPVSGPPAEPTGHDAGDHSRCCGRTPPAPAGYDPQPTLIWDGTMAGLADAYDGYARILDGEYPGWWRDDTTKMAPGLAAQAMERRNAEGGGDRG
nr:hypothetical protein [Micromonospora sp. DSM 115978]